MGEAGEGQVPVGGAEVQSFCATTFTPAQRRPKTRSEGKSRFELGAAVFFIIFMPDLTDSKADSNVWGINLRGRAHYAFDS
jgi:hypothetical protein